MDRRVVWLGLVAALAGCAQGTSPAPAVAPPETTATLFPTAAAPPPAAPPEPTETTGRAKGGKPAPRPCRAANLTVSQENWRARERTSDGTPVTVAIDFKVTSTAPDPCAVRGWASLDLRTPTDSGVPEFRIPGPDTPVTLTQGTETHFSAIFRHCLTRADRAALTLPDDPTPIPLTDGWLPACAQSDIGLTPFGTTA
ncbi:hypothetical protein V5P93_004463 [Actinokineospora auranticolor]|uniref:hypothetical protein n=1 Tax=Actinokineospora auranticolor TaxID=155976 RepID=UPI0011B0A562